MTEFKKPKRKGEENKRARRKNRFSKVGRICGFSGRQLGDK